MDNYIQIGKDRITISCETADNLKKQFGKPEIRDIKAGSCGLDDQYPFFIVPEGKKFRKWYLDSGIICEGILWTKEELCQDSDIKFSGNIFDLIKAQEKEGEDLDRTNIDGFVLEICSDRIVVGGRRFLIKQAEEFYQKLGQIIATAKRKDC